MKPPIILRHLAERAGITGILGIALLAFSAMFAVGTLLPLCAERDRLAEAHQRERATRGTPQPAPRLTGAAESARQLAAFYSFFPPAATATQWLREILDAAKHSGLSADSGEYRLLREKGAKLARYQITVPVSGSYAQLRRFIGRIRATVPAAVLEEVTLQRDSVDSDQLDARIRYTIHLAVGS